MIQFADVRVLPESMGILKVKQKIQRFALLVITLALLFLLYRWATGLKESGSQYIQFPDQIETFK